MGEVHAEAFALVEVSKGCREAAAAVGSGGSGQADDGIDMRPDFLKSFEAGATPVVVLLGQIGGVRVHGNQRGEESLPRGKAD